MSEKRILGERWSRLCYVDLSVLKHTYCTSQSDCAFLQVLSQLPASDADAQVFWDGGSSLAAGSASSLPHVWDVRHQNSVKLSTKLCDLLAACGHQWRGKTASGMLSEKDSSAAISASVWLAVGLWCTFCSTRSVTHCDVFRWQPVKSLSRNTWWNFWFIRDLKGVECHSHLIAVNNVIQLQLHLSHQIAGLASGVHTAHTSSSSWWLFV